MNDLGALTQLAVLDALASGGAPEPLLQSLQPHLVTVRQSYRGGDPPPFEDANVRSAYAIGYFPHHATLAAAAYGAAGSQMLGLKDGASVVVLGAGPGPEVVGLAQFLTQADRRLELDIHLVDRQAGWRETRAATIDAVLERIEGFDRSSFRIHEHKHDLASTEGIKGIAELLSHANLVVVETLLTELPAPEKDGHLVDWLIDRLPHDGRLLLLDLQLVSRYATSQSKLRDSLNMKPRLTSRLTFPAAAPLAVIQENFFPPGEYPRKRLEVSIELYSRPGCPMLPLAMSIPFKLNEGQEQALEQLKKFFHGPERVFVLTGAAGTGKTALFPGIVSLALETGLGVELMAPTGQAARRLASVSSLGASTVHSTIYTYAGTLPGVPDDRAGLAVEEDNLFDLVPPEDNDESAELPVSVFKLRELPDCPAIYVIDEASLIGNRSVIDEAPEVVFAEGTLLSDLLKFALSHPDSRVIFVGDTEQLPPVGEQLSPALAASEIEKLTGSDPDFATLTQVMRQDENSGVLSLADRARSATIKKGLDTGPDDPEAGINLLKERALPGWVNDALIRGGAVAIAAENAVVERWNTNIRKAAQRPLGQPIQGDLVSVLRRDAHRNLQNGDDLIVEEVTDYIHRISIKGQAVTLREARFRLEMTGVGSVIFNAPFVEGLLYRASAEDHKRVTRLLFIDFQMRNRELKPGTDDFNAAYEADPWVNALRVSYSYARTCHRAQGGEWSEVIIDFSGGRWLGPTYGRWCYTAVTRAKASLWLTNLAATGGPLGSEFLAEGAAGALQAVNLEISGQRPIQHGTQLEISGASGTLLVNLFEKKGKPSRVVITGSARPDFTDQAIQALEAWIRQTRIESMDPLPERLEKRSFALGSELQEAGYDYSMGPYADYQVEFILRDSGVREARAVFSYNGNGQITAPKKMAGDPGLLRQLREAVESELS